MRTSLPKHQLKRSLRGPKVAGAAFILIFFGGFGAWATLAPLAGAAVAPGIVSPEGSTRPVQHLEGGIVDQVWVTDGSVVDAGEPLLTLRDTQAQAALDVLASQHTSLSVLQARLEAEQEGATDITLPIWLSDRPGDTELRRSLAAQRDILASRQATLVSREQIIRRRIAQSHEEIGGLEAQIVSLDEQLALIRDELTGVRTLFAKGLIQKPRLRALERAEADLIGKRAANTARIARVEQSIAESELQIVAGEESRRDEINTELASVNTQLAEIREPLQAAQERLDQTIVRAPIAGTVVSLRFTTANGVIGAGERIMSIVPATAPLLIDARITPTDIDMVSVGQDARLVLSAYDQRTQPRITGTVAYVSADRLTDPTTQQPYFLARVAISEEALDALPADIELSAGMPADVMILTGERTLLTFLLEPFTKSLRRSFKES